MSEIHSSDYRDYVIKNGKFVGEFEQMYRHVADPWQGVEKVGVSQNNLLVGAVGHVGSEVKRAWDVGCGLGALTERFQDALPWAEWSASDVSPTAVERAARAYPRIRFFVHDLGRPESPPFEPGALDLITMAQVMWYVLPHLSGIFDRLYRLLRPGGHLIALQYFLTPEEQKYGKEIVASPSDLLRFVRQAGFEIRQEAYVGAQPPQDLLLWAVKAA